ncbi:MAG TPA: hypothetical protein VN628_04630 [Vicinamibacterales bacterium]|nr:hypothetical protein [Vicinamibacterales bacterium]
MAEMKRDRDQDQRGSNRQSNVGMGGNQDMQSGRGIQESKKDWDGTDRRMGTDRRHAGGHDNRIMNEGSSR